jgi:hypothetical protein
MLYLIHEAPANTENTLAYCILSIAADVRFRQKRKSAGGHPWF